MITKGAETPFRFARPLIPFSSAREAFRAILTAWDISPKQVLLPAYIGWSAREGSGVFDPIASLHLGYRFYGLDGHLRIDLDSLRAEFGRGNIGVFLIIHYFGYVDPCYEEAVSIAREHGAFVLEDEAHAMLTDLAGGICGRLGDACIYSFHKMLPVPSGGAAVLNDPASPLVQKLGRDVSASSCLTDFDLPRIAAKRRENGLLVDRLVHELLPCVEPLFGAPRDHEIPQTYPVLIRDDSRDRLYFEMNAAGFGVVSLYHTLISEIPAGPFPATLAISRQILNLPVHQDASERELASMVQELAARVNG